MPDFTPFPPTEEALKKYNLKKRKQREKERKRLHIMIWTLAGLSTLFLAVYVVYLFA